MRLTSSMSLPSPTLTLANEAPPEGSPIPNTPPSPPAAQPEADLATLKKLGDIARDARAGVMSDELALRRLARFRRDHPEPVAVGAVVEAGLDGAAGETLETALAPAARGPVALHRAAGSQSRSVTVTDAGRGIVGVVDGGLLGVVRRRLAHVDAVSEEQPRPEHGVARLVGVFREPFRYLVEHPVVRAGVVVLAESRHPGIEQARQREADFTAYVRETAGGGGGAGIPPCSSASASPITGATAGLAA